MVKLSKVNLFLHGFPDPAIHIYDTLSNDARWNEKADLILAKPFAPNHDFGKDFEKAPDGFVDYVLLNTDQRPVVVVEAKREKIDPLSAKEQARAYAEKLGASHIFLSNGLVHYYWNLTQGNPVKVSRFLPLDQLGKAAEWKPDAAKLSAVPVDENYIAVSQDASWLAYSAAEKAVAMVNKKIRLLRDYLRKRMISGTFRSCRKSTKPTACRACGKFWHRCLVCHRPSRRAANSRTRHSSASSRLRKPMPPTAGN